MSGHKRVPQFLAGVVYELVKVSCAHLPHVLLHDGVTARLLWTTDSQMTSCNENNIKLHLCSPVLDFKPDALLMLRF